MTRLTLNQMAFCSASPDDRRIRKMPRMKTNLRNFITLARPVFGESVYFFGTLLAARVSPKSLKPNVVLGRRMSTSAFLAFVLCGCAAAPSQPAAPIADAQLWKPAAVVVDRAAPEPLV